MNTEDKLHFYRLTNVAYGILESTERSRSELLTLRYLQISTQQKSLGQRIVGVLLSLAAVIPAVYGLLPSELGKLRFVWLTGILLLASAYLATVLHQWRSDKKEAHDLLFLLPAGAEIQTENRPEFLAMLLSSYRTRWQMARDVLCQLSDDEDDVTRKQFAAIVAFWERRMGAMAPRLKGLLGEHKISQAEYDALTEWMPSQK
jgi:hypothetical protein